VEPRLNSKTDTRCSQPVIAAAQWQCGSAAGTAKGCTRRDLR